EGTPNIQTELPITLKEGEIDDSNSSEGDQNINDNSKKIEQNINDAYNYLQKGNFKKTKKSFNDAISCLSKDKIKEKKDLELQKKHTTLIKLIAQCDYYANISKNRWFCNPSGTDWNPALKKLKEARILAQEILKNKEILPKELKLTLKEEIREGGSFDLIKKELKSRLRGTRIKRGFGAVLAVVAIAGLIFLEYQCGGGHHHVDLGAGGAIISNHHLNNGLLLYPNCGINPINAPIFYDLSWGYIPSNKNYQKNNYKNKNNKLEIGNLLNYHQFKLTQNK
ncbi:MAG: hypothetical protein GY830_01055, partial [Bacteroidetes bacterium]|nr:hypothetical protein [Bacteroidota bacterium]